MVTVGPTATRGFLFADLRDYTSYVEARGDVAAAELLRTYRGLVRERVAASSGAEIKTEGDSFYVVFPSASSAVMCALDIVDAAAVASAQPGAPAIRVGVGVHAGETAETEEGYVGSAVNIAARVCAQAASGEVLVTDTVRSLTRTLLPVRFVSRGERRLKGIDESVGLYAVERAVARAGTEVVEPVRARSVPVSPRVGIAATFVVAIIAVFAIAVVLRPSLLGSEPTPPASFVAALPSSTSPATEAATTSSAASSLGPTTSHATAEPSPTTPPPPSSPSPAASVSPGQEGFPTVNEAKLLDRIPRDVRTSCRRALPMDGALGSVSLVCDPPLTAEVDRVWWDSFDTPAQLDLAYGRLADAHKLEVGDCAKGKPATQAWDVVYTGHLACWSDDEGAHLAWTYEGEENLILGRAERSGADLAALYAWWQFVGPFLY